jgi:hypothetical protein
MVIMTLLGIPFLLMGETENRIAENEQLALQALYAAESGAWMVKRWFDQPGSTSNVINPPLAAIDREQRLIDADGDPGTAPAAADGSAGLPYYKQDDDALFEKPYRGSAVDELLGTEDGPDMVIDAEGSTEARNFLVDLSDKLFGGYPSGGAGRRARIARIDVYGPPHVRVGGTWKRYGVGSARVVGRIVQEYPDGTEVVLAERTVGLAFNEVRYAPRQLGTLNACSTSDWNTDLTIHWGALVHAAAPGVEFDLPSDFEDRVPVSLPRVVPPSATVDLLWGWEEDDPADADADGITSERWHAYYTEILEEGNPDAADPLGYPIQDPWFRLLSTGVIKDENSSPYQQPYYDPALSTSGAFEWDHTTGALENGDIPYNPSKTASDMWGQESWTGTYSNHMHKLASGTLACPDFDYAPWKEVAVGGGDNIHYYTWAGTGDQFLANGEGTAQTFRQITDGQTGFFFFDTKDGAPPQSDGSNLTPAIVLSSGTWGVQGMVYLNATRFEATNVVGRATTFRAPGEPFQDRNADGVWQAGEGWLNLHYPTTLTGEFRAKPKVPGVDDVFRDPRGPAISATALVDGLLYTSGRFDMKGTGNYYGAIVARRGISEAGSNSNSPHIYWNEDLRGGWPPDAWGLPRVVVSRWETEL